MRDGNYQRMIHVVIHIHLQIISHPLYLGVFPKKAQTQIFLLFQEVFHKKIHTNHHFQGVLHKRVPLQNVDLQKVHHKGVLILEANAVIWLRNRSQNFIL